MVTRKYPHATALLVLLLCSCYAETPRPAQPTATCVPGNMSYGCQSQAGVGYPTGPYAAPQPSQPQSAPSWNQAGPPFQSQPNAPQSPPQTSTPVAGNATADDVLGRGDTEFMHNRVRAVTAELAAALEPALASRVRNIPIVFDPNRAEVNAFATCARGNKSAVAVTDGMLILISNLAQLRAVDEIYGTQRVLEYTTYIAQNQAAGAPLLDPPPQWLTQQQRTNAAKVSRQLQRFDEMIAFVFGHEYAHHYLNHLPCTSVLPLEASELGILLTDAVPAFNQPAETAADIAAVRNVLEAGRRRQGGTLTEDGAITQLRFFAALDSARPIDVFSFERTHPPPSVREPVVQTAAQAFRVGGGITWPWGS